MNITPEQYDTLLGNYLDAISVIERVNKINNESIDLLGTGLVALSKGKASIMDDHADRSLFRLKSIRNTISTFNNQ